MAASVFEEIQHQEQNEDDAGDKGPIIEIDLAVPGREERGRQSDDE